MCQDNGQGIRLRPISIHFCFFLFQLPFKEERSAGYNNELVRNESASSRRQRADGVRGETGVIDRCTQEIVGGNLSLRCRTEDAE